MDITDIGLRHLRYFVAVAEELHFGRAAQRLHIAQPPLSQQIRKLEEAIGHPLLLRNSRQVRLTGAGEELLKRAQQTLRKVAEDIQSTRRIGRGEVGTLTVGFIASAMLTVLPSMLSEYRRRFPEVELRLREFYTSGLLDALRNGTADIGFTRDADQEKSLHTEVLLPEPTSRSLLRNIRLRTKLPSASMISVQSHLYFSHLGWARMHGRRSCACVSREAFVHALCRKRRTG